MKEPLCQHVERFADGELSPADAEVFRRHAATCTRCEAALAELAQLDMLGQQYRARLEASGVDPATAPANVVRLHPRWRWAGAGAISALAAALVVTISMRALDRVPDSAWYPGDAYRLTDARSSYPRAAAHRPLKQGTLGSPGTRALPGVALGRLEEAGDGLGVAALHLARGTPADAQEALRRLAELQESPDVLSEMASAYLVNGDVESRDAEQALRLASRALERRPDHAAALWNRALAHRALGLWLLAARDFDAVAALGEPGWKDEASARAGELRRLAEDVHQAWRAAVASGKQLVTAGALPQDELLRRMPVLRHFFYDAVRTRSSRDEVLGLLPAAQALDAPSGDGALARYVQQIASRSFATRAPLAHDYARLAAGDQTLETGPFLARLRAAGEADLLLGALGKVGGAQLDAQELERLARASEGEAWLHTLALRLEAEALQRAGEDRRSRDALAEGLRACMAANLEYRCVELELDLTYALDRVPDLEQGLVHARHGWQAAVHAGEWGRQAQFILELAQLTSQRDDPALASAYYEEALEREKTVPDHERYAHEGLALIDVQRLRFREARRHLDAALATGLPLGLTGARALANVARVLPSPGDTAAMEAFRNHPSGPPFGAGEQALARHALGRWTLENDRQRGIDLLNEAIRLATADGLALRDPYARKALSYSDTSLILDAGKRGDAAGALDLFEREWLSGAAGALPARCLLAVAVDGERTLAIARGAGSAATAHFDDRRTDPLPADLSGLLPDALKQNVFQGCATVSVLARAPAYGRPGLLPANIAWSYLSAQAPPPAGDAPGPGRHLVIQQVSISPARRGLKAPPRWEVPETTGERVDALTDQDATPSAVLRRMEDATAITVVTHALVNPDSEEAFLVLAPEAGGDAIRASDLQARGAFLRRHPLVVLASCKGAQPGPVLHEARSLPAAFRRAGARAVLAASDDVPDQDGPRFFAAVRERIVTGTSPAEALRDVRADWRARGEWAPWLDRVLLFQ